MRSLNSSPSLTFRCLCSWRPWAAAWFALAAVICATAGRAAEREVVGVLALALEPEIAQQIGLTPAQLAQINQIVVDREAEVLDIAADFRGLTPDERFAKLAPFRKETEEKGLAILSPQQRAKLEQLRFKRYGLSLLADPVIAERLRIPPDQQAAFRQAVKAREEKLRELGPNALAEEVKKLDEPITAMLEEPQRAALRALLMGEIPAPAPNEPVAVAALADDSSPAGTSAPPSSVASGGAAEMPPVPETQQPERPALLTEEAATRSVVSPGGNADTPGAADADRIGSPPASPASTSPEAATPAAGAVSPSPSATEAAPNSGASTATEHSASASEHGSAEAQPIQDMQPGPSSAAETASPPPSTNTVEMRPAAETPITGAASVERREAAAATAEPSPPQAATQTPAAAPTATPPPSDAVPGTEATVPKSTTIDPKAGAAAVEAEQLTLPPSDVRLRFNFRYQPWQEVLKWFAEQAGLSLVMEAPPSGTFNYVDDREFAPSEAIDLLNSVLLMKGYMLVRKERMLILLNLDDGIPPNLVDTVLPEDLDKRGDHELVSTLFQLQRMSPEEAETEVKKLLGPQGSVLVLPKSKQLFVTETAGKLRTIRRVIDAIENPQAAANNVRVIQVNPSTVDQVLNIVRQMFQIPADQNATADGSLRFALDPGGARLLVTGTPDMLDRFNKVVEAADPTASGGLVSGIESTPQLEVYPVTAADPQAVLEVLQTLLVGMPDVRLAIDPRTGNLIAFARPAQHATIRATLQQLQGEAGQVEVIPLRVVDPQLAVLAINKLFGSADGGNINAPTVDADIMSRQLLIRGSRAQIEQIREMLRKMGEPEAGSGGGNVNLIRTIPMSPEVAEAMLRELQAVWPNMRENRLQVIMPRSVSEDAAPPKSSGGTGADSQPAERGQLESFRIPLGAAGMTTRRLVGGGAPNRSSGPTASTSSSTPAAQPQPTPTWPAPTGWGPPGGFGPPGPWGPPGGFQPPIPHGSEDHEHRSDSDRSTADPQTNNRVTTESKDGQHVSSRFRLVGRAAEVGGNDSVIGGDPQPAPPEAQSPATVPVSPPAPSEPPAGATPIPGTGTPPVVVAVTPDGLVIASQDPDALNQLEDLLRRMMTTGQYRQSTGPELVVYYLKHAKAETAGAILDQIFGGGTLTSSGSSGGSLVGEIARAAFGNVGGGLVGSLLGAEESSSSGSSSGSGSVSSRIQITPDNRLNALIVQAYPEDLQLIEEILRVLDRSDSPEDVAVQPKTIIIPVRNTQAEEIAGILRSVYQDRLVTGSGQQRAPSPQELIQLLRGGRGGGGGRSQPQEEAPKMSIGVDSRTNSLIVSAPEKLLKEVQQLVEQLDQRAETESEEATQVVTLQRANPESIRSALTALLGGNVQIRGSTGASGTRTGTTTTTNRSGTQSRGFGIQPGGFQGFPGGFPGGFRGTGIGGFAPGGFTGGNTGARRSGR
ncbi:MAG: secretin N-terminal domain-containing protein [Thermogutta sp.]